MEINLKALQGLKVYRHHSSSPWGTVSNISLNPSGGRIAALLIDTISLIPLQHTVTIDNIIIENNKVYLKNDIMKNRSNNLLKLKIGERILLPHNSTVRLRDLNFDLETGEISDIIVSRSRLSKKNKISINKFRVKDNTIYVD